MPNFGEQPTSPNRERLDKNEEGAEDIKKQLLEAVASENADRIIELGEQMKSSKGQREEFINKDKEEAYSEDTERTTAKEAEKLEAKKIAKELEDMKLKDETESSEKANEILKKINRGEVKKSMEDNKESVADKRGTSELLKEFIFNGKAEYLEYKLKSAPENIKADKEFMTEALKSTKDSLVVFSAASESLRNNKEFVLFAMSVDNTNSHSDMIYEKLSPELKNDKDVVLGALKSHTSLDKIPKTFKDKETVLFAFQNDTSVRSVETIPNELMSDKEIALTALKNQQGVRGILSELPKNYRNDKDFVLEAIKDQPYNYLDASDELKNNPDVASEAIKIDSEKSRGYGGLVEKLPWDLKTNKEFMKKVDDLQKALRKKEEERRDAAWKASQEKK